MEQIQADGNGGIQIQRSAGKLYIFMHVNALSTVCARANNTTGLVTSYQLLPHTTYLMCTEEEYNALQAPGGTNPAPARTAASDAGVRASGGTVKGCKAINTGDGLGSIVCAIHGKRWQSYIDDDNFCTLNALGVCAPVEMAVKGYFCCVVHGPDWRNISNCSLHRAQFDRIVRPPPVAQVGGAHYQQQPGRVQHWDYAAGLLYCEGQVSRYLDRHAKPGGYGAKDVLKSLSYLLKILEVQYHDRWSEHEDMLRDLQARLADAYKAECSVPKRETVGAARRANQCANANCTKDAALGGPYCVDCTTDFS